MKRLRLHRLPASSRPGPPPRWPRGWRTRWPPWTPRSRLPRPARPGRGRRLRRRAGRPPRRRAARRRRRCCRCSPRPSPTRRASAGACCVARAGLLAHGLSLAHTHVRLNAAQLHNAVRLRLGLDDPPADPLAAARLLAAINAALDAVQPVPVDFGALLAEQASAARLMMTVAQIAKHVDGASPVRFLIAETESGYTLLAALWLARLFGSSGTSRSARCSRPPRRWRAAPACSRRRCARRTAATTCAHRAAVPAVRLLRQRPLRRPARRHLPDRAAAAARGRAAGPARPDRRRGRAVRHPRREHRPRRASRARWPTGSTTCRPPPAGRRFAGPACACARRAPSRAATATCCSARRRWRWPRSPRIAEHAFAAGRPPRTRSTPTRTSPPTSSPPSARHARAGGGPRLRRAARRLRPGAAGPDRVAPSARQSDGGGPRPSATRASCGPSPTTPSCSSSAGARTRCTAWAPRPRGTRSRSPSCARQPRASAARWTWPATRCALRPRRAARRRRDARPRRLAGPRRPRAGRAGARRWSRSRGRWSALDLWRRRRRCSAASRPTTCACAPPGPTRRAWQRGRCCCTRCAWR